MFHPKTVARLLLKWTTKWVKHHIRPKNIIRLQAEFSVMLEDLRVLVWPLFAFENSAEFFKLLFDIFIKIDMVVIGGRSF